MTDEELTFPSSSATDNAPFTTTANTGNSKEDTSSSSCSGDEGEGAKHFRSWN
jgi:hypothetical protein